MSVIVGNELNGDVEFSAEFDPKQTPTLVDAAVAQRSRSWWESMTDVLASRRVWCHPRIIAIVSTSGSCNRG